MSTQNITQNRSKIWLYANVVLALFLIAAGIMMLFWMEEQSSSSAPSGSINQIATQHQGRTAPDFTLSTLSGQQAALSDYAGQVVLINTWATWCPPCKAEMPTQRLLRSAQRGRLCSAGR